MNEATPDRKRFEAIEAYVMGRMSADERERFQQEIAADPALHSEVELHRENTLAIELGGMDRLLKVMRVEQQQGSTGSGGNGWIPYLKYAATVALFIAGVLWWMGRAPRHERVFAAHFTPDPGLPVTMGTTDAPAFHDAMVAYKLGDHDEAIDKFTALLKEGPASDTLRFYIGCAELNAGRPERAAPMLMAVAEQQGSVFAAKARWYAFLAILRGGDLNGARAIRFEEGDPYGAKVKAVLSELE